MKKVNAEYADVDERVEKWAYIETERFKKIFEQIGLENGLLRVGRIIALYRLQVQAGDTFHKGQSRLAEQISELEKSQSFSHGVKSGSVKAAKAGASARGLKYATMKSVALDWYLKNRQKFQNKDDAAIEITKNHAVEFSTARGWLKGA